MALAAPGKRGGFFTVEEGPYQVRPCTAPLPTLRQHPPPGEGKEPPPEEAFPCGEGGRAQALTDEGDTLSQRTKQPCEGTGMYNPLLCCRTYGTMWASSPTRTVRFCHSARPGPIFQGSPPHPTLRRNPLQAGEGRAPSALMGHWPVLPAGSRPGWRRPLRWRRFSEAPLPVLPWTGPCPPGSWSLRRPRRRWP